MTYFRPNTEVLENSKLLTYKADKIRNSNLLHIFQELIWTVKRRRKLSNNDILRFVIQNEELPNAISTKFNKVQDFKLGDLEQVIIILDYCQILARQEEIPQKTSKSSRYFCSSFQGHV